MALLMCPPSVAREHVVSRGAGPRRSDGALVFLAGDPGVDSGGAVADTATELHVGGSNAEAAPVGEGSSGESEDVGDVVGGHQFVERDDIVDGGLAGHRDLRSGGAVARPLYSATVGGVSQNLSRR